MYREDILDLYRNPRNEGELETEFHAEGENPSCGDSMEVFLEIEDGKIEDGKIEDVRHRTDGCAISTAAISILTEEVKGMKVEEVKELDRDWIIDRLGIELSPMRVKCAVLGLKTVQKAIGED